MKSDLEPEAVAARLETLRRLTRPVHVDSLRADRPPPDLSPHAVRRRLELLRALCELTDYLHARRVRRGE